MDVDTAADLIRAAVPPGSATWADLGSGSGTFALALAALLGPDGRVFAMDNDGSALSDLRAAVATHPLGRQIIPLRHDFRKRFDFPALDGVLLANALHFVAPDEQADVLQLVKSYLRPTGRLLVVDYDGRAANAWVPYPVSRRALENLFKAVGLGSPSIAGTRPSRYGGTLFAAWGHVSASKSE